MVAGNERLGRAGSLPVSCRGRPVERCPLAVLHLPAVPGRRHVLVLDSSAFVRLRRAQERPDAGGERLQRRRLGDGCVMLRLDELLAGGHRVLVFPLSSPQFIEPRADSGDTITDPLAAGLPALRPALHNSSMPDVPHNEA